MGYLISIFISTFVLEDVALASALAWISEGKLSFTGAFLACFFGIAIGDLGLYLLGNLASHFEGIRNLSALKKHKNLFTKIKSSEILTYSIIISRIIPGTRLPTYLSAGFLCYPFIRFFILTVVSVFAWVFVALFAGRSLQAVFMDHWLGSILVFILGLQLIKSFLPKLCDTWDRKALLHSWRKYAYFEYWPAWFFYIPIIPYYIYLSLKHKSFVLPFYASPGITHAGLIGESKWDFLKHLKPSDSSTLTALKIKKNADFMEVRQILEENKFHYPFIMKPDVGQRGFGVRMIHDDYELTEYLLLSHFEVIVQKLSQFQMEAGLFYVRLPHEKDGKLFSITDKKFPFVVGDEKTKLGDLILKNHRARMIAPVYFTRLRHELDSIPHANQPVYLTECGNHCQGAIFLNGKSLNSELLRARVDEIAKTIPNFYFGRFDVRYKDTESLQNGRDFEIVEVNGAGAEATHIWDPQTKLTDAYSTLFNQWKLLFEVGKQSKEILGSTVKVDIKSFLKECAKVYFRKETLSVSS